MNNKLIRLLDEANTCSKVWADSGGEVSSLVRFVLASRRRRPRQPGNVRVLREEADHLLHQTSREPELEGTR